MKKKPKHDPLERVAFHEAGHAVMYINQRRAFKYITIEPDDDRGTLGHLLHDLPSDIDSEYSDDLETRLSLEADILCSLAGPAAEGILVGRRNWRGARSDLELMVARAIDCTGSPEEASAFVSWLWIRANNTMRTEWRFVQVVAAALLEKKTLSYSEVKQAIDSYVKSKLRPVVINPIPGVKP